MRIDYYLKKILKKKVFGRFVWNMSYLLNMHPGILWTMSYATEVYHAIKFKPDWYLKEKRFDPKFICPSKNAVHSKISL